MFHDDRCEELVTRANDMEEKNLVISRVACRRSQDFDGGASSSSTHEDQIRQSLDGHAPCTLIKSVHVLSDRIRQADIAFCEVWASKVCSTGSLLCSHREIGKLEMAMQRHSSCGHMYGTHTGKERPIGKSSFGLHYCR